MSLDDQQDALLNEHEAARLLGCSIFSMQRWRVRGTGPAFYKIEDHLVRYAREDIEAYKAARRRTSTSDNGIRPAR